MSTWTHVVGAVRFDGIPGMGPLHKLQTIEEIVIGVKKVTDEGVVDHNWRNPLPMGSEGPIQYKIHEYGKGLPWIIITIWGDLRDYDDVDEIDKWFMELCGAWPLIRDGVLSIRVDDGRTRIVEYSIRKENEKIDKEEAIRIVEAEVPNE